MRIILNANRRTKVGGGLETRLIVRHSENAESHKWDKDDRQTVTFSSTLLLLSTYNPAAHFHSNTAPMGTLPAEFCYYSNDWHLYLD